jgi:hypothetical protein
MLLLLRRRGRGGDGNRVGAANCTEAAA